MFFVSISRKVCYVMRMRLKALFVICVAAGVVGCATAPVNNTGEMEGTASWYGGKFIGRKTANGEIFTSQSMTAASKTLPFDTRVLVTDMDNGKSVIVRINDRGPYVGDRILDLSYAAAKAIDMIGPGTATVRLRIVTGDEGVGARERSFEKGAYYLQVGLFSVKDNAEGLRSRLSSVFDNVLVDSATVGGRAYYRVLAGPFPDEIATYIEADKLKNLGYVVIVNRK